MCYSLNVNYERSFPAISDSAKKKFAPEFSKLKEVWQTCHQAAEQIERDESAYKDGCVYTVIHKKNCLTASVACGGSLASLGFWIPFYSNPAVALPAACGTACFGLSAMVTLMLDPPHKLTNFQAHRETAINTILKVENLVKVLNKISELFAAWEIAKEDSSEENLILLYKNFKKVQKAELGLTSDSIDPIESLLLMDNLCQGSRTDQKLIQSWKTFVTDPGLIVLQAEELQPINIEAVNASSETYRNYFKIRDNHTENQIERKIVLIRDYINKEFK